MLRRKTAVRISSRESIAGGRGNGDARLATLRGILAIPAYIATQIAEIHSLRIVRLL